MAMNWSQWHYADESKAIPSSEAQLGDLAHDPLWAHLSDEQVAGCMAALQPHMSDERNKRFDQVIGSRTDNVRWVFENPGNLNNVWAALRTLDSFGVQFVDIIIDRKHTGSEERERHRSMSTALGSQKWLTLRQHSSTASCLTALRDSGHAILCTDLHDTSLCLPDVQWDEITGSAGGRKVAIVMGNERSGISAAARQLAAHSLYIPMKGFAESLNLSVACAVICATLASKQMLPGNLPVGLRNRVQLTWLARTVKGSPAILRRHGYPVHGDGVYNSIGGVTSRP